jgi:hypothetical protein
MIRWQTTPKGYVVYQSTRTGKKARIWVESIEEVGAWCARKQNRACQALTQGDFAPATLVRALKELGEMLDASDEDYVDLAECYDDLRGILRRIRTIEED